MAPVVVVGAGPSGLAIALRLVDHGVDVVVVERADRVGGRVYTARDRAFSIEHGPAGILDGAPDTRALLGALGSHAPTVVPSASTVSRRYLVTGGKPRALPSGPLGLLFGSALSLRERLSLLREPFVPRRSDPAPETVAAFTRRRFGDALATRLAQPMVLGVFGGDYAALELDSAFPFLRDYEHEHGSVLRGVVAEARSRRRRGEARARLISFEGGMGALPAAMAAKLGDRVRLSREVVSVDALADDPVTGNLTVQLRDGIRLACRHLVLATEPDAAASLTKTVDATLSDQLSAIPSTPIASVHLAWPRAAIAHPLDGFGVLSPRQEGLRTMGVLFMSSIFPTASAAPAGTVLLRVMVGGANDPQALDLDDETLLSATQREVSTLLRISGAPTFRHLVRWPRAIAQYPLGHAHLRVDLESRARARHITVAGTALHGVGVNDVIRDATRVVERLLAGELPR